MATKTATPWGPATLVEELSVQQRSGEKRFASVVQLLEGEELSVFAIVDGKNALALPESRDYSRVGDGDTGPNTGGMVSRSSLPRSPT